MACIVCVIGITHFPFHYKLISQPRSQWPPDTEKMVERGELMRDKLRQAKPDVIPFALDNLIGEGVIRLF